MYLKVLKFFVFIFFVSSFLSVKAQNTVVNSEVGVLLGPTFFQGDYGEAGNFKSATANVGMGFEFAYVMDFSDSRYISKFFQNLADHVKGRLQLSYTKIKLKHKPIPVSNTSPQYTNFKDMYGETKIFNFGIISEIYFRSLMEKKHKLGPYITLGVESNFANPSVSGSSTLPTVYTTGNQKIFNKKQNALSFVYGLGTRYRLDNVDLVFEGKMHSFLSDRIEGLDPQISGDKNNDSMVSFRLGVVFRLDDRRIR